MRIGSKYHHHEIEDGDVHHLRHPEKRQRLRDRGSNGTSLHHQGAAENDGTLWICQLLIADRSPRHQKLMTMIGGANATP
jgi:hypothetical protein